MKGKGTFSGVIELDKKENDVDCVRTSIGDATGGDNSAVRTNIGDATGGGNSAVRTSIGDATGGDNSSVRTDKGDATGGDCSAVRTREGNATGGDNSVVMGSKEIKIGKNSVGVRINDSGEIVTVYISTEKDFEIIKI